jgi:hypothetical protein
MTFRRYKLEVDETTMFPCAGQPTGEIGIPPRLRRRMILLLATFHDLVSVKEAPSIILLVPSKIQDLVDIKARTFPR